ncbi:MAG: amino acid ABC transporter ATP-binding protein [Deltaproteobacteria bacterium]|nr:amino acid ABC transporter ATP-binding protein [Deltaproteobacteria bacterium]
MITLENITKRFGTKTILNGISASFDRGAIVCLVGPSGGGKTTLLRCLNGLESFDEGQLRIGETGLVPGGERHNRSALKTVRARVGFVFQQWHLFAHRTALGNVIEAPMYVQKIPVSVAISQAKALLSKVGMDEHIDKYPHELSGGQQQRVAIARALAMRPDVLLMDEPTSALDPERVQDVATLLRGLSQEGLTLVIVTHEMGFVRTLADVVCVLHGGNIVEKGSPAEVLSAPSDARTRAFLGMADQAPVDDLSEDRS